jgi:predicted adenine nucleotide alpha hydrolase (AANH) superfamily ATPase
MNKLKATGEAVAVEWGLNFYYQDFRPLFSQSRQMAKEQQLYLQKYCGCLFSEKERHKPVKINNSQKQLQISK